jgi:sugar O-acyltransferase (sialic acid O-acetyltransferase NeuD family)
MTKDLVIIGCGGLGREAVFLAESVNRVTPSWNLLGYVGREPESVGQAVGEFRVVGDDEWLRAVERKMAAVLAIGNPALKSRVGERLRENTNLSFPNLIHPSATGDWQRIKMGEGNLVFNATGFTTGIVVGSFTVVNPGCTVAHDCTLGSWNLLGPGVHLAGGVSIGNRVVLGVGAQVLPGVAICDDVTVGGGAVVTRSIARPGTYVGVPARFRDRHEG